MYICQCMYVSDVYRPERRQQANSISKSNMFLHVCVHLQSVNVCENTLNNLWSGLDEAPGRQ